MRNILIAGVSALALSATGAMAQTATIDQDGDNGSAFIDQVDADSGADADITQGVLNSSGFSDTDTAAIEQVGNGSLDATILQNTDQNLLGSGGDNIAGISQGGGSGSASASIEQAGSENLGGIVQPAEGNTATIEQGEFAFANTALVKQGGGNFSDLTGPVDFEAELNPDALSPGGTASDSDAFVSQTFTEFSRATVLQSGENQDATVLQQDIEQTASVDQSGKDNVAFVDQGLFFNRATVIQESEGNDTFVDQFFSEEGVAEVTQTGDFNDADVIQTGFQESAFVNQTGSGGIAEVDQSGTGNTTNVNQ